MKRLLATTVALMTASAAYAQQVEITWAGIYTADSGVTHVGTNGITSDNISNVHLAANTADIPMQEGVRFGVQYRLTEVPGETVVNLRKIMRFPAPGLIPPSTGVRVPSNETVIHCVLGRVCMTGYQLTDPWEMVPGTWKIEIWSADRKLAEQSFNISAK